MKHTLSSVIFMFIVQYSFAQQNISSRFMTEEHFPDAVERYNIDYSLKDYTFNDGDSTILYLLDLEYLEDFRAPETNVEVVDPNTGLVVVLFNRKRNKTGVINSESNL